MANKKISQLPVATTPLSGSELVPVVQSSTTTQTTVQDIIDLVQTGGTFSPTTSSLNNITSITVVEAIYTKVGSIATASYTMQVTPTGTGACYAEIDLHIVSSLLGSGIGSGSAFDGSFYVPVLAYGGSTTSLCAFQFDAQSTSVYQVNFTVTYQS